MAKYLYPICVAPLAIVVLGSGQIFYSYDFDKPALWIALYGTLFKTAWAVMGAIFFFGTIVGRGCKLK